jgi:hypothetical protein
MTDQRHAIIDIKFSSSKPEREGIAILSSRREDRRPAAWYRCKALAREERIPFTIRRRELTAALGGVPATWPLVARADEMSVGQQKLRTEP